MSTVRRLVHPNPSRILRTQDRPLSCPLTTEIGLTNYSRQAETVRLDSIEPTECLSYLTAESVSWIDIQGLGREDLLQELGDVLNLHPQLLEDIANVPQRPRFEDYDDQLLMICRMVKANDEANGFDRQQVSLVLGANYVLVIQEALDYDSCFNKVGERIRRNKGTMRKQGADYLLYCLLDVIISGFFPVLEDYGERLEELENEVVRDPCRHTLERIYQMKRELLMLRRSIWPQRDAIDRLMREESPLICNEVRVNLRDCYNHAVQAIDMVETYREIASSLMEVYLSSMSKRMNENIRFLTVFSTIFLPLTFIVGIYGMNFEFMPELKWKWGYPVLWLIMLSITGCLLFYFYRKGWLVQAQSDK
ncbi:magnesium/cobalt transporter CorA [Chamaesiphon polymorphus]|uniref:Magnesium transport protein CorA n=1 Tax=Chamaesiphon polymorphus CCALA 037 TaxID=2107692 RepID=A0A2T1GGG3_9CYAN|nr:magnesium/cobalt transporter CorA [Chamaesiphon polymorphus]PSB56588.1 magnesium and cobalt transport protein CorA [Chamaesiphon polymorphus CCALA 037]